MAIFWRPQLAIGHDEIDADHRYLILLINTVELVLRFPESPQHVLKAFDELEHYAKRHFEREEIIQISWGYIHVDEHKLEHRRLLQALTALRMKVETALLDPNPEAKGVAEQSGEISAFLRHWLLDHVIKSDAKLSDLFRKPDLR